MEPCPRGCGGSVFYDNEPFCINCGWRGGSTERVTAVAVLDRDEPEDFEFSPPVEIEPEPSNIESGCSLYSDCLTCPEEECRCKDKDLLRTPKAQAEAIRLYQEDMTPEQIAKELNKSICAVRRWVK